MAHAISRRKLAQHTAAMIVAGKTDLAIRQLAAFLLHAGRTREADLVVRDIETELAHRGTVVATVTTARPLSAELRAAVTELLHAKQAHINEIVDSRVLGGIRIDVPGKQYDTTVRRKLELLKELTLT